MVADVPFIGADAGAVGKGPRPFVIAGIVGDDGDPLVLEREADRLSDAAAAAGDDCDACHENSPPDCQAIPKTRGDAPQVEGKESPRPRARIVRTFEKSPTARSASRIRTEERRLGNEGGSRVSLRR